MATKTAFVMAARNSFMFYDWPPGLSRALHMSEVIEPMDSVPEDGFDFFASRNHGGDCGGDYGKKRRD